MTTRWRRNNKLVMYCGGFLLKEQTDVRDYQISYVHHKNPEINNSRLPCWFNFSLLYYCFKYQHATDKSNIFDSCCVWISSKCRNWSKREFEQFISQKMFTKFKQHWHWNNKLLCLYIYNIYIHTHTYIYIYIYTHTHTHTHTHILPLNRIHIMAAIISSEWCKYPSTEITFFFSNTKLSQVKNTLLQKQQCKFPNFSSRYDNKGKGKGKVVFVQAMKVQREKCYSVTHS